MAMLETNEPMLDGPIPGESLTAELGARPWQTPPELPTLEEALDFYLPRLSDKAFAGRMLDIVERGVPITALVETITLGGVMQGLHTIDVAILVNPVLVEFVEGLAQIADIEYKLGDVDESKAPDKLTMSKVMRELRNVEMDFEDDDLELTAEPSAEVEEPVEQEEEAPKGLMARRETM